jgi:hypothetical protein
MILNFDGGSARYSLRGPESRKERASCEELHRIMVTPFAAAAISMLCRRLDAVSNGKNADGSDLAVRVWVVVNPQKNGLELVIMSSNVTNFVVCSKITYKLALRTES